MGQDILAGHTYDETESGSEVNFTNLNAHVNDATLKETAISARTAKSPAALTDLLLISDGALKKTTIQELVTLASKNPGAEIITDRTAESAIVGTDVFLVYDASASALRKCTRDELIPAGAVVQVQSATYATYLSSTTPIPYDDTIPLSSEGTEVLSATITPATTTNIIEATVSIPHLNSSGIIQVTVALFRGTTCVGVASVTPENTVPVCVQMSCIDSPASTSAQTYSVRVGATNATTIYVNGYTSRLYGGACKASLIIKEIKA